MYWWYAEIKHSDWLLKVVWLVKINQSALFLCSVTVLKFVHGINSCIKVKTDFVNFFKSFFGNFLLFQELFCDLFKMLSLRFRKNENSDQNIQETSWRVEPHRALAKRMVCSVTRLGNLLHLGQVFKSLWQQMFCPNLPHS